MSDVNKPSHRTVGNRNETHINPVVVCAQSQSLIQIVSLVPYEETVLLMVVMIRSLKILWVTEQDASGLMSFGNICFLNFFSSAVLMVVYYILEVD